MIVRQRDDLLSTEIGFLRHVLPVFGLENIDGSEMEQRAEPTVSIRMRLASSFNHLFSSWLKKKSLSSVSVIEGLTWNADEV